MDTAPLILVVEDEFFIAMEMAATLEDAGFRVLGPAVNVDTALQLLRVHRPDVAVLDVNLQGVRVTPAAQVLRAMGIPFLLTSALEAPSFAGEPILRDAVNVGKPLNVKVLLQALSSLLHPQARP